jgi:hypothetical protein
VDSGGFVQRLLFLVGSRPRTGASGATTGSHTTYRRSPVLLVWCAGAAAATSLAVQATGKGVDVLVVVLLCCAVVALERTLGDLLAELVGSGLASVVFAVLLGAGVWLLFAEGGKADQFYTAAERSGYQTLYHRHSNAPVPDAAAAPADGSAPSTSTPTAADKGTVLGRIPADRVVGSGRTRDAAGSMLDDTQGERGARATPLVRLETPEMSMTGRSVTIRAHVSAGGAPLPGVPVEFTISGRHAGAGTTDSTGAVSTAFVTRVAGTYQVEARITDRRIRQPTARTLLYVLPGRSSLLLPFTTRVPA